MSKNLSELLSRKGIQDSLFDKLGNLAEKEGTVNSEDLDKLAEEFLVGTANALGTISFYDFLKPENKGKKIYVCNGSACLCAGTQKGLIDELSEHFDASEIGHMTCLGRCHENKAFNYDGKNYSGRNLDAGAVVKAKKGPEDKYKVTSIGTPLLTSTPDSNTIIFDLIKKSLKRSSDDLLEEVKTSGVRGRGGAGFPMGLKLQFCRNEENDTKFIICNADEGDPGAYSDRYLLELQPMSVLFGMLISGYITGANWGIVYIRAEYPESVDVIDKAIKEMIDGDVLGKNIDGSGFDFEFKIIKAQGSYICGEETALINSIEGQRPEVRLRPPYPAQQGLFNKPTVVNNVETLAAVYHILKNGAESYAKLGTEKSKGTKLISLDSFFKKPGIVEVEMGTPLTQIIEEAGGGFAEPVKALHIGGPLGGLVPTSRTNDLTIDFESFASNGFLLGHAGVVSVPRSFSMLEYLEHIFEFASYESCGKCFPCRLGTKRGQELLTKARTENYKISRKLFDDLLETLEKGSLCAHGGGIPLPIKNALEYFADELSAHFES